MVAYNTSEPCKKSQPQSTLWPNIAETGGLKEMKEEYCGTAPFMVLTQLPASIWGTPAWYRTPKTPPPPPLFFCGVFVGEIQQYGGIVPPP